MPNKLPSFKPYNQHQIMMLPPSLEELIADQHAVRVVNDVIDRINVEPLLLAYHTKGTSSNHPVMLLKVLVMDMWAIFILPVSWKQPENRISILCGWAPWTVQTTVLLIDLGACVREYQTQPWLQEIYAQEKKKVEIEWGLIAIALNIRKKAA